MPTKVVAFSRRLTSPSFIGNGALLYVMPSNMITVETGSVVGLFSANSMQDDPTEVTVDFFLTDPRPLLPQPQSHFDGSQWAAGPAPGDEECWLQYDANTALTVRSILESAHQFTIPITGTVVGMADDWVNIEDYKWIGIRVAYATNPTADVYVQITPQTLPEAVQ